MIPGSVEENSAACTLLKQAKAAAILVAINDFIFARLDVLINFYLIDYNITII
jgi:hypothetical protein